MIEVDNLTKSFGQIVAVDNVSFKAKVGEVVGFLGPNGAGKSTTMKMLTGYLIPTAGSITVLGMDFVNDAEKIKANIGYLPEGAPAYGDMTTYRYLDFIASIRGFSGDDKLDRLAEIIDRFHLEGILNQQIDTLSKGFNRRVGLAQAIVHDPKVLILDEPTDGLDPNQKHEVRQLILELAKNKIIILSTHILEEVYAVCDRAVVISKGKIVADSTPRALAAKDPKHNVIYIEVARVDGMDITELLLDIPGIHHIEMLSGDSAKQKACLYPAKEGGISVSQLHHIAYQQDWELLDIQTREGQLENIFREITVETGVTEEDLA